MVLWIYYKYLPCVNHFYKEYIFTMEYKNVLDIYKENFCKTSYPSKNFTCIITLNIESLLAIKHFAKHCPHS